MKNRIDLNAEQMAEMVTICNAIMLKKQFCEKKFNESNKMNCETLSGQKLPANNRF